MVLAMGLVFVLLLGEIDLSAGFTAGTGAAILGVTLTEHGWAWPLSVLAALADRRGHRLHDRAAGGAARASRRFVVSLAFFLGLQGAMLLIIGEGGTIPIRNERRVDLDGISALPTAGRLFGQQDDRRSDRVPIDRTDFSQAVDHRHRSSDQRK